MTTILRVDSSGRHEGSHSRVLTGRLVERLLREHEGARVIERDAGVGLPVVDESWIGAAYTPPADRSVAQESALTTSDGLVEELEAADIVVIGAPIYNFGVSAGLKSWIDQVCRANRTFRYTEQGPVGLLQGKRAFLVVTSGGTDVNGEVDFATPHLVQVMRFIGIEDVRIVAADRLMIEGEGRVNEAYSEFEESLAA